MYHLSPFLRSLAYPINMEKHEENRDRQLKRLKETIDIHVSDKELKVAMNEIYDSIALVSAGVDDAHNRLDIRKDENSKLSQKITELGTLVFESMKRVDETNRKTARNSKISMISNLIAVFFSLFLIFGGAEALRQLGLITTAIKAIDIIA